jgi:hypothetical protein
MFKIFFTITTKTKRIKNFLDKINSKYILTAWIRYIKKINNLMQYMKNFWKNPQKKTKTMLYIENIYLMISLKPW